LPDAGFDPYIGVGVNRTFFFNESLNGTLAGNNLQLSNAWGYSGQAGVDWKFGKAWVAGVDLRYIQIEPDASLTRSRRVLTRIKAAHAWAARRRAGPLQCAWSRRHQP
jgi:outer membrane protein W